MTLKLLLHFYFIRVQPGKGFTIPTTESVI